MKPQSFLALLLWGLSNGLWLYVLLGAPPVQNGAFAVLGAAGASGLLFFLATREHKVVIRETVSRHIEGAKFQPYLSDEELNR